MNMKNVPCDGLKLNRARRVPTTEAKGEPNMRTRLLTTTIVLTLLLALASLPAFAGTKVDVCHIPAGNPDNFHTISVSENALAAHLGHGDLEGTCAASCESLCDDGDACTQDVESDLAQCTCNAEPRPAVDCDDSNLCTVDGCNSEFGCTYDPDPQDGVTCDDGDPNTSDDVCTGGVCAGGEVSGCTGCFDCGTNSPCGEDDANQLLPHCDPQAYIQCNVFFGCRIIDCGDGSKWNQALLTCVTD